MGKIICSRESLARYTVVKLLEKCVAQMRCTLQGLLRSDQCQPFISKFQSIRDAFEQAYEKKYFLDLTVRSKAAALFVYTVCSQCNFEIAVRATSGALQILLIKCDFRVKNLGPFNWNDLITENQLISKKIDKSVSWLISQEWVGIGSWIELLKPGEAKFSAE